MMIRSAVVSLWVLLAGLTAAVADEPRIVGEWEVRWDRGFTSWKPVIFEGRLTLQRDHETWSGAMSFVQSTMRLTVKSVTVEGDRFLAQLGDGAGSAAELRGWVIEDRLLAEMRAGSLDWQPLAGRRVEQVRLVSGTVPNSLPRGDLARSTLDPKALDALIEAANRERSSALVIIQDGKILVEMYRPGHERPLVAMSASKSVVSMALGHVLASAREGSVEGSADSTQVTVDTRLGALYEEWAEDPRGAITIRQLLSHTSGLDPERASFEEGASIREHALGSQLVFDPGSAFAYNNNAVDFLAAVAERVTGVPLDEYLERHLFGPLDFVDASWMEDEEGTPRGAGELIIRPVDLAKLGQLMLDGGRWGDEQVIARAWVDASTGQSQPFNATCGLLWWREVDVQHEMSDATLETWAAAGVGQETIERARPLLGKSFTNVAAARESLAAAIGEAERDTLLALLERRRIAAFTTVAKGGTAGYSARGWLGQYLVVLPEARLVAVRMRQPRPEDYGGGPERDAYRGFLSDVRRLVPAPPITAG